ncbi:hypothetical protein ABIA33_005037 [Streptacidiphilus sp. MAP12-16]|uniref:hypothetical protein n=1 Tax=Streptacidiphilus sp. MAP12-16 TaxID=3156300 RepID=UPI0035156661
MTVSKAVKALLVALVSAIAVLVPSSSASAYESVLYLNTGYHVGIYTQPATYAAKTPNAPLMNPGDEVYAVCWDYGTDLSGSGSGQWYLISGERHAGGGVTSYIGWAYAPFVTTGTPYQNYVGRCPDENPQQSINNGHNIGLYGGPSTGYAKTGPDQHIGGSLIVTCWMHGQNYDGRSDIWFAVSTWDGYYVSNPYAGWVYGDYLNNANTSITKQCIN